MGKCRAAEAAKRNPNTYSILRQHPGDLSNWRNEYDLVDAAAVIHWFRADRPGLHRGIPELTPALPLFAQLRRYTLAVLAAAETAADFAAVLFTDSPANGEAQALDPMDVVELEKRMATVLPDGWKLGQIEAQQPTGQPRRRVARPWKSASALERAANRWWGLADRGR